MERTLEDFLEECLNTDPGVDIKIDFHRNITDGEQDHMNSVLKDQGSFVYSKKCDCCLDVTEGQQYHVIRKKKD